MKGHSMAKQLRFLVSLLLFLTFLISSQAPCQAPLDALQALMGKRPQPPPQPLRGVIGDYEGAGTSFSVREEGGALQLVSKGVYPLKEIRGSVFEVPEQARLGGTELVFLSKADEFALLCTAGANIFHRTSYSLTITPQRDVGILKIEALKSSPPSEKGIMEKTDLVDIQSLIPDIRLDIRYATSHNFMGLPFYDEARAFLQRPAAEALVRAKKKLASYGFGLVIFDAYRPWYVTKMFWEATPPEKRDFVADPEKGSFHNRGMAVDLALCDGRNGRMLDTGGEYDEFGARSLPDYPGGTSLERWHRKVLRAAMESEGFVVYPFEWWHFTFRPEQKYPLMNIPFQQLHQ
jgi:D-alanyl-D-alanine dipeptidase